MIRFKDHQYTMAGFAAYQSDYGQEPHSMTAVPLLIDPAGRDFHLTAESPCVNAGADIGIHTDFENNPRPQGAAPDMGAYELAQE